MKQTPASFEAEHIVLLPAGLTGSVTLDDGTTYDLGPGHQTVLAVDSADHSREAGFLASKLAVEHDGVPDVVEFDEEQSRKNLGLNKKKG